MVFADPKITFLLVDMDHRCGPEVLAQPHVAIHSREAGESLLPALYHYVCGLLQGWYPDPVLRHWVADGWLLLFHRALVWHLLLHRSEFEESVDDMIVDW